MKLEKLSFLSRRDRRYSIVYSFLLGLISTLQHLIEAFIRWFRTFESLKFHTIYLLAIIFVCFSSCWNSTLIDWHEGREFEFQALALLGRRRKDIRRFVWSWRIGDLKWTTFEERGFENGVLGIWEVSSVPKFPSGCCPSTPFTDASFVWSCDFSVSTTKSRAFALSRLVCSELILS